MKTKKVSTLYFLIHGLVEFICFGYLYSRFSDRTLPWMISFIYDFLAFVPQGIIGDIYNRYRRFPLGSVGFVLIVLSLALFQVMPIVSLILIALGNACIHVDGAVSTTKVSEGKLFPGALFVSGGSFGVIIGQFYGQLHISLTLLLISAIVMEVMIIIVSRSYDHDGAYPEFSITRPEYSYVTILVAAFVVVAARSFVGYAIPISWKKEVWQSFLLFFTMGLGKAMGGYLSDRYGPKTVGVVSTLAAIPLLIIGRNIMVISIIGVFMFSLTMSITFGMCLSVMSQNPGLAFGITTLGLFAGSAVLFFVSVTEIINVMMVVILSLVSAAVLYMTLK